MVATKLSLKYLARRILDLNDEIAELDRFIIPLVEELAPSPLELKDVGTENAGAILVAVGDNPDRLRSQASFAMMCGVCPIPASSGRTQRHVADVPRAGANGMGEVAVIAGSLLQLACQIDPPVRFKSKLAADAEPTAYRSVSLPKGNRRNTA